MSSVAVSVIGIVGALVIAVVLVEGSSIAAGDPLGVRKVVGVVLIVVIVVREIIEREVLIIDPSVEDCDDDARAIVAEIAHCLIVSV